MKLLVLLAAAVVVATPMSIAAKPAHHAAKVAANPSVPQSADIAKLNRKSLASIPATPGNTAMPAQEPQPVKK